MATHSATDNNNNTPRFLDFVYEIYRSMKAYEISLIYEGEVSHDLIKAFTSLTQSNLTNTNDSAAVQRRIFHVMIETLQNVSKHSDEEEPPDKITGRGIFIIARNPDEYSVTTGNAIDVNKKSELCSLINHINGLTKDELDALYKKQIREGTLSCKGGAGLGFIDIVRKTGRCLDYHFISINQDTCFFLLTAFIPRNL